MSKILRYLACLFMLIFAGNALAAGYSCPSYKKYTSCASGYYMTSSSSSKTCNTTANAGNACRPCSVMGSNYTCAGGTACPKLNSVTCRAGYYLPANATSCRACGGNNYYCKGGTFNVSSSAQGRRTVSSGYYSTGGTSTTRTGQSACGGNNYYCSGGVRYTVSSGYYSTGGTSTTRTGQSQCTAGYYCSSGVRTACSGSTQYQNETGQSSCKTVSSGYYKSSNSAQTQCPANYRDGTGAANINACKTSCAGGTYVATANAACTSVGTGYYKGAHTVNYGSTSTRSQCPANYRDGAAASAQNGCKTSCAGGTYVATANAACTSVGTGYYRAAHTVNYGSTSTRSQCPSGYRDGAATSAQSGCKMDVEAGHYVGTANSATQATCAAGTYKAAHTITYGSTSSCSACSGRTKYSAAGASACKTVSSGYYTTGCNTSGNNCTGQSQCTGATYCSGGVQNSCPAQTSGWTRNGGTGWTSYTQCNQTRAATSVSSYCSAGQLKQTATSATAWGASTISTAFQAKAGAYVNGTTCSQCTANDYCAGGTAARKDCPSGYPNSAAGSDAITDCYSNTKSRPWSGSQVNGSVPTNCYSVKSWNACSRPACNYVAYANTAGTGDGTIKSGCTTNNASCEKTPAEVTAKSGYYDAGTTCSECPNGYPNSANGNEGGNTKCYISVSGGHYIGTQYSATQSECVGGTYKAAHTVYYGSTSSCSVCGTNQYSDDGAASCKACKTSAGYGNSGTTAVSHDGVASCKVTCDAGEYVPTAGGGCVAVGSGYYKTGTMTVAQNATNTTRSACSSLSGVSVSGGTYSSVSPYNASTTCRYKAPNKTITGCDTVTSATVSYSGSAWPTTTYTVSADPGYYISGSGTASATCVGCQAGYACAGGTAARDACDGQTQYQDAVKQSSCKTVSSGWYKVDNTEQAQCTGATYCSGGVKNNCPAQTSGWTRNGGTGWTSYTQCNQTRAATSISTYCSAGTLKQTATSATAWGASTISTAFQAKAGAYVNGQTCSQCTADNYCTGGTAAPTDCPSGYPNSDAGAAAITSCYSNSKSRAWTGSQVNGSVPNNCASVTSWNSCSNPACSYVAYSNSAGTGDGTIKSGCSTNNGNCTKTPAAVTAKAGYYDAGTSCSACPSGYPNSDAGNDGGITKCYSDEKSRPWGGGQISCATPTGCSDSTCNTCTLPACSYVAYSNSTGSADGTIKSGCSTNSEDCQQTVKSVTAKAGRYVSGITCPACAVGTFQGTDDSTATSCTVCAANTYAASTGMSACTACPSGYSTSGTAASNHDAKSDCSITCAAGTRVVTADAACTTPTGSWYTASHSVAAGSTTPAATVKACLTNYSTPNTTTRTDHDASTDCKISCAAGTRVATENATSCTTPAGNWYVGAHSVAQGSISSYSNCLTNYTISGTAAANHDTASDCKISCGGGSYIATANNTTCSDVGAGYWAAASTVSQGSAGVRNACDDGLTTIGSGAGADEVGDCGRVLNVNGEKIYLRSERKTTPSLNVSINGTTFYGNMGASGIGALKLNSGGTTYSVYDDSME